MGARIVTWIDDQEATVELLEVGATVKARIETKEGSREVTFSRQALQNGELTIAQDATRTLGWVGPLGAEGRTIAVGSQSFQVLAKRELDVWLRSGEDAGGSGAVSVSMPGRVVKVLVQPGEAVAKGQPVLIIEAMKMENEVKARRGGHVVAVHVAEGESVEGGKVLMGIGD